MKRVLLLLVSFLPAMALAASVVEVSGGWVRAMPPGAKNSAGYLELANVGDADDALLGASVQGARVTELHEMVHEGGAMTMRRLQEVPLPAHGRATLAPGGAHLMLIDLQRSLKPGERLPATLRFRLAGDIRTELEVRAP